MARYSTILRDQNEVPISGAVVSVINPATGALAALTDDLSASLQNPFTTNVLGDVTFNAADNVYRLEYRVNGIERRIDDVIVGSPSAFAGPSGPAFATYFTLANFKAASTSNAVQILQATGIATGLFYWETANAPYTADNVNVIKADSTALSVGAWVRQSAAGITDAARLSALAASGGSALVDFLQSGTGAVARTAQAKLRDTVSVKDFGATGDGTTDDTAAIQAAITSLVATGGSVIFPQGRYKVTSTITVSSELPISLIGEMFGDIYAITNSLTNAPCIIIGAAMTHVIEYVAPNPAARGYHGAGTVKGLAFADIAPAAAGTPGTKTVTSALHLKDFSLGVVENCTFTFIKGSAISAEFAVMSTVKGCRIRYCGDTANPTRAAVLLAGASSTYAVQSFVLHDCRIEVCHSAQYLDVIGPAAEVTDVFITHCNFEAATTEWPTSNTTFIRLNCERYLIHGCSINRVLADAVVVSAAGRGKISGCHFTNAGGAGRSLVLTGSRNIVTGNIFEDSKTTVDTIYVDGVDNDVSGNVFYSTGAVNAVGRGFTFHNNQIISPTKSSGYFLTLGGNMQVASGNRFDSSTAPACGGIQAYTEGQVLFNMFDRWSALVCIRRETAGTQIWGNQFGTVATAYSEAVAAGTGSGLSGNATELLSAPSNIQVLTGAGAVNLTSPITHLVTTGANALTLANGVEGQRKIVVMKTAGGTGTLTPTSLAGAANTITFDDVGDSTDLIFTNGSWYVLGGTAVVA